MSAASFSAPGMEQKYVRMRIMLYVLISPGRMRHHMVLSRLMFFKSRYIGIMPSEKYIVNSTNIQSGLRPTSVDSESG